jgi:hypothetical protein
LGGPEGTCVTILEAQHHLGPSPATRSLLVLGNPDVFEAGAHVGEILECRPIGLEGLDDVLVKDMQTKGIHPKDVELGPPGGCLAGQALAALMAGRPGRAVGPSPSLTRQRS